MSAKENTIEFIYKNYKGEVSKRRAIVKGVVWESNQFHPEPQWIMVAHDLDKDQERRFAIKDMMPLEGSKMNRVEFEKLKKEFDEMSNMDQYHWLVNTNLKKEFVVYLDDDSTSADFDIDDEYASLSFKDYVGNGCGVEYILDALGINWKNA